VKARRGKAASQNCQDGRLGRTGKIVASGAGLDRWMPKGRTLLAATVESQSINRRHLRFAGWSASSVETHPTARNGRGLLSLYAPVAGPGAAIPYLHQKKATARRPSRCAIRDFLCSCQSHNPPRCRRTMMPAARVTRGLPCSRKLLVRWLALTVTSSGRPEPRQMPRRRKRKFPLAGETCMPSPPSRSAGKTGVGHGHAGRVCDPA
jgi:hypothetical protein